MGGPEMDGTSGLSGRRVVDEATLDDVEALAEGDPGGMLRFTASAGAQVRESASLAAEANLAVLGDEDGRGRWSSPGSARPVVPGTCWPRSPGRAARCR
ncbi:hypothetical protein GCM10027605_12840 [Micromonospora zhanjiangensis]